MSEPRYDVIAIGNAIVDVMAPCQDELIAELGLNRGGMTLVDAARAEELYAAMGPAKEISGGSAANTLAGMAMLGAQCGFIGQVAEDQLGAVFAHDIRAVGVDFDTPARAGNPPAQPAHQVERAQSPRTFLQIRFEVVRGVVEARMPRHLFRLFCGKELARRPDCRVVDDGRECRGDLAVAGDEACIEQRSEYRDIGDRQLATLRTAAYGMTRLDTDIPQAAEERFKRTRLRRCRAGGQQHQQVDIGLREQDAATETTDREQGRGDGVADTSAPDVGEDALNRARARGGDISCRCTATENSSEIAIDITEQLAQRETRVR